MTIDEGTQAELAFLIRDEKQAQEDVENAREEVLLWIKRGKLAVRAGKPDLARQAKAQAVEAKITFDEAQARLESIGYKKKSVIKRSRGVDAQDMARTESAEGLVEQFRLRGISPEEQETKEIAAKMEAELAVEDIKAGREPGASAQDMLDAMDQAPPVPPSPFVPPEEPLTDDEEPKEEKEALEDEDMKDFERRLQEALGEE